MIKTYRQYVIFFSYLFWCQWISFVSAETSVHITKCSCVSRVDTILSYCILTLELLQREKKKKYFIQACCRLRWNFDVKQELWTFEIVAYYAFFLIHIQGNRILWWNGYGNCAVPERSDDLHFCKRNKLRELIPRAKDGDEDGRGDDDKLWTGRDLSFTPYPIRNQ
jgi:hypothetical protein